MAMIQCPECQESVSDTAMSCPACGFEINKPERTLFGKIIKYSFIGFNILMLLWVMSGVGSVQDQAGVMNGAEALGAGIGMMVLIGLWVAGDIILGFAMLFSKPKS